MLSGDAFVAALLRSPLHRLLSGTIAVLRHRGRRTGQEHATPVQYARRADSLLVLCGHPESKTWWRNFRTEHDAELLVRGEWLAVRATAFVGGEEPETTRPLLSADLERFQTVSRLEGDDQASRLAHAVVVQCSPR